MLQLPFAKKPVGNNTFLSSNVGILLCSLFVALVTLRDADCIVTPGLDASFRWALNHFLYTDKGVFSYINYTVGPLCLLKWPAAMGDHIFICTLFQLAVSCTFTFFYTSFFLRWRGGASVTLPLLACSILLLLVNLEYVMIGSVATAMLYYHYLHSKKTLLVAVLLTVACLFIKNTVFVLLLCMWLMFVIYLLEKKQYKELLFLSATGLLLVIISGCALTGSFGATCTFVYNNIAAAVRYSDGMNVFPHNNRSALVLSVVSLLLLFALFSRQQSAFLFFIFSLCLFANWKYSMASQDFFHSLAFIYLLLVMLALFVLVERRRTDGGTLLLLLAISSFTYNIQYTIVSNPEYFWLPSLMNAHERLLHPREFKEKTQEASMQACAVNKLPDQWLQVIGKNKVDVFPWDLSIVMVNNLNYTPRTCLQTIGLNTVTDQQDADFLLSPKAPAYVIWHATPGTNTAIDGLAGKYLPNECPATMAALLSGYGISSYSNERFSVWVKRAVPVAIPRQPIATYTVTWNEWLSVPAADTNSVIMGRVSIGTTATYTLRSIFYKGLPLFVEYETDSGRVIRFRFTKAFAEKGMLVGPLYTDNQLHKSGVKRMRFINSKSDCFTGRLNIRLEKMSLPAIR